MIQFVAHFLDVAGLLFAQQVAAAPEVKIMAGKGEASAQRVQRLQNLQAALRSLGEDTVGRRGEQGIGALLGAADTSA